VDAEKNMIILRQQTMTGIKHIMAERQKDRGKENENMDCSGNVIYSMKYWFVFPIYFEIL